MPYKVLYLQVMRETKGEDFAQVGKMLKYIIDFLVLLVALASFHLAFINFSIKAFSPPTTFRRILFPYLFFIQVSPSR